MGQLTFIPASFIRVLITLADLFSNFLNFVIPLMIVALITKGIAELTEGAGKLLGVTFLSAYASTLVAVGIAYVVAAPGATGGAIMFALQFLPMVGIISDAMQQLMIVFILRKTVKPKTKARSKV